VRDKQKILLKQVF